MSAQDQALKPPAVTLLYVPADQQARVAKALTLDADVVIVDLEDSVAPGCKAAARVELPGILATRDSQRVQVRVNGLGTPWGPDDLAMVRDLDPDVEVRLPKVESPADVDRALEAMDNGRRVHCLLETATAVEHAFDIGSHGPNLASIGLGEQDLRSQLGLAHDTALDWARGRLVMAAAASGLPPPVQSVYTRLRDFEGLAQSCAAGRARGFVGRCAIHPAQLPVIRSAFRPDAEDVRRARELLVELKTAHDGGRGVAVLEDGSFVDAAMAAGARRVLQLEEATARADG